MTHGNSSPSAQETPLSLAGRLLRVACSICGGVALVLFMLFVILIVPPLFSIIRLLWFYIGAAAVSVIFPSVFIAVRCRRGQSLAALLAAAKWSGIAVGLIGLLLCPSFLTGYWLHVKIWLNPAQVRQWAAAQQTAADRMKDAPQHWPSSLQNASSSPSGHLTVDFKRQRITLVEGGGFGHWGIEIAPPENSAPEMEGHTLKVADGVWVWHEIQ